MSDLEVRMHSMTSCQYVASAITTLTIWNGITGINGDNAPPI